MACAGDCCDGVTGDWHGQVAAHAAANLVTSQLRKVVLVYLHCGSEQIDNGVYSTFNHQWHQCYVCSLCFSAGYQCVGVLALDCLGVASQEQTSPLIMVAMEPVSSSFAGLILGLVDSGASFNFMSHELYMKLGWMVDKHQQASVYLVNGIVVTSEGRATGIL